MHVVVIGAGLEGLTAAHRLQKAGAEVTVVERDAYGQGPSHGNAAFMTDTEPFPVPNPATLRQGIGAFLGVGNKGPIRVLPPTSAAQADFLLRALAATRKEDYVEGTVAQEYLSQHTAEAFDELAAEGLKFDMNPSGTLRVYENREQYDQAMVDYEAFPSVLARVRTLDSHDAIAEIDPLLGERYTYALYAQRDRVVEPESLMRALIGSIRAGGGTVLEHTEVVEFVRSGGSGSGVAGVVTSQGVVEPDAVVIAAGVGSRPLAAKLGYRLPVFGGGGYSLDFEVPADRKPAVGVMTGRTHVAITPLPGDKVRISSGMIVGQSRPVVSDDTIARLVANFTEAYPEVPVGRRDPKWAGLRPFSADGVPVIGRVPGVDNAYLDTGHLMLGLTYAPISARVLTDIVLGKPQPAVYALFSPERFLGLPGVRRTVRVEAGAEA